MEIIYLLCNGKKSQGYQKELFEILNIKDSTFNGIPIKKIDSLKCGSQVMLRPTYKQSIEKCLFNSICDSVVSKLSKPENSGESLKELLFKFLSNGNENSSLVLKTLNSAVNSSIIKDSFGELISKWLKTKKNFETIMPEVIKEYPDFEFQIIFSSIKDNLTEALRALEAESIIFTLSLLTSTKPKPCQELRDLIPIINLLLQNYSRVQKLERIPEENIHLNLNQSDPLMEMSEISSFVAIDTEPKNIPPESFNLSILNKSKEQRIHGNTNILEDYSFDEVRDNSLLLPKPLRDLSALNDSFSRITFIDSLDKLDSWLNLFVKDEELLANVAFGIKKSVIVDILELCKNDSLSKFTDKLLDIIVHTNPQETFECVLELIENENVVQLNQSLLINCLRILNTDFSSDKLVDSLITCLDKQLYINPVGFSIILMLLDKVKSNPEKDFLYQRLANVKASDHTSLMSQMIIMYELIIQCKGEDLGMNINFMLIDFIKNKSIFKNSVESLYLKYKKLNFEKIKFENFAVFSEILENLVNFRESMSIHAKIICSEIEYNLCQNLNHFQIYRKLYLKLTSSIRNSNIQIIIYNLQEILSSLDTFDIIDLAILNIHTILLKLENITIPKFMKKGKKRFQENYFQTIIATIRSLDFLVKKQLGFLISETLSLENNEERIVSIEFLANNNLNSLVELDDSFGERENDYLMTLVISSKKIIENILQFDSVKSEAIIGIKELEISNYLDKLLSFAFSNQNSKIIQLVSYMQIVLRSALSVFRLSLSAIKLDAENSKENIVSEMEIYEIIAYENRFCLKMKSNNVFDTTLSIYSTYLNKYLLFLQNKVNQIRFYDLMGWVSNALKLPKSKYLENFLNLADQILKSGSSIILSDDGNKLTVLRVITESLPDFIMILFLKFNETDNSENYERQSLNQTLINLFSKIIKECSIPQINDAIRSLNFTFNELINNKGISLLNNLVTAWIRRPLEKYSNADEKTRILLESLILTSKEFFNDILDGPKYANASAFILISVIDSYRKLNGLGDFELLVLEGYVSIISKNIKNLDDEICLKLVRKAYQYIKTHEQFALFSEMFNMILLLLRKKPNSDESFFNQKSLPIIVEENDNIMFSPILNETNLSELFSPYPKEYEKESCTYSRNMKNKEKFSEQHYYQCYSCDLINGMGCCSVCAYKCHAGHDLAYSKKAQFFCDCGSGGLPNFVCKCIKKRDSKKEKSQSSLRLDPSAGISRTFANLIQGERSVNLREFIMDITNINPAPMISETNLIENESAEERLWVEESENGSFALHNEEENSYDDRDEEGDLRILMDGGTRWKRTFQSLLHSRFSDNNKDLTKILKTNTKNNDTLIVSEQDAASITHFIEGHDDAKSVDSFLSFHGELGNPLQISINKSPDKIKVYENTENKILSTLEQENGTILGNLMSKFFNYWDLSKNCSNMAIEKCSIEPNTLSFNQIDFSKLNSNANPTKIIQFKDYLMKDFNKKKLRNFLPLEISNQNNLKTFHKNCIVLGKRIIIICEEDKFLILDKSLSIDPMESSSFSDFPLKIDIEGSIKSIVNIGFKVNRVVTSENKNKILAMGHDKIVIFIVNSDDSLSKMSTISNPFRDFEMKKCDFINSNGTMFYVSSNNSLKIFKGIECIKTLYFINLMEKIIDSLIIQKDERIIFLILSSLKLFKHKFEISELEKSHIDEELLLIEEVQVNEILRMQNKDQFSSFCHISDQLLFFSLKNGLNYLAKVNENFTEVSESKLLPVIAEYDSMTIVSSNIVLKNSYQILGLLKGYNAELSKNYLVSFSISIEGISLTKIQSNFTDGYWAFNSKNSLSNCYILTFCEGDKLKIYFYGDILKEINFKVKEEIQADFGIDSNSDLLKKIILPRKASLIHDFSEKGISLLAKGEFKITGELSKVYPNLKNAAELSNENKTNPERIELQTLNSNV